MELWLAVQRLWAGRGAMRPCGKGVISQAVITRHGPLVAFTLARMRPGRRDQRRRFMRQYSA